MEAYKQIAERLRASLAEHRLTPGTVLLEGRLAEIFGASRTPVRQALDTLLEEGLLSRFDGRGLVVGDGTAPLRRTALAETDFGPGTTEIVKRRGWQALYQEVERILIHCSIFGAYRINELELAAHFSIGRTVARDVLTQAEGFGLLTKDASMHWVTVPLDDQRLADLYDLRETLEPVALIRAMGRIEPARLAAMRQRVRQAMHAYPDVSAGGLDQLEHDLHVEAAGLAGNREMLHALKRTRCVIISSRHILGSHVALPPDDPFLEEHDRVLSALARQDAAAITAGMAAHLRSAHLKVGQRLGDFRKQDQMPRFSFIGHRKTGAPNRPRTAE